MKQSAKSIAAILAVYLFSSSAALAGFESKGGGAFVCRDADQKISTQPLSVELLDLWEAQNLNKLHLHRDDMSSLSVEDNISAAFEKLKNWDPVLFEQARGFNFYNSSTMVAIRPNVVIAAPNDVGSSLMKQGCPLEGVASYSDVSETLFYDPTIISAMGSLDYAALIVHEAIYKARRIYDQDTNSIQTRRIVGFLFSHEPVPSLDKLPAAGSVTCETNPPSFSFNLFREPSGLPTFSNWYVFQFSRMDNACPMRATEVKVPDSISWISGLLDGTAQNLAMTTEMLSPSGQPDVLLGIHVSSDLESLPMVQITTRAGYPLIHCH